MMAYSPRTDSSAVSPLVADSLVALLLSLGLGAGFGLVGLLALLFVPAPA